MINKPISEKAIALPFSFDSYGNVNITTTQSKIWADRVKSVVGTMFDERVMRPKFGTSVPQMVWDVSELAQETIQTEIRRAFLEQLPLLELEDVEITFDEYTNVITANIVYGLPNSEQDFAIVGIATISADQPITEENR